MNVESDMPLIKYYVVKRAEACSYFRLVYFLICLQVNAISLFTKLIFINKILLKVNEGQTFYLFDFLLLVDIFLSLE